jgi:hypothetical protein
MDLRRLTNRAKNVVNRRGGTDALKDDLNELKDIAKGKGSVKDKAKAAADALKDPGKADEPAAAEAPAPAAPPAPVEPPAGS